MARRASYRSTVAKGNYLETLRATRDAIATDLEACESMRDKAALYLRMADVLARIEDAKPAEQKGDAVDEIARRRAARRSVPAESQARANHPS